MISTVHNRDIKVPEEMLAQFPALKGLLDNPELNEEFVRPEAVANRSKFLFNAVGLSSLILIILVFLIATWRLFVHAFGVVPPIYLLWVSAGICTASLTASLLSHFLFQFQQKWLHNRFIAERLRQWKFQQLLDGMFVDLSKTEPAEFERELKARWVKAKFDVIDKPGTMYDFVNGEDFQLFVNPSVSLNEDLGKQVIEAYRYLRLDYQATYFSLKKASLRNLDVWTNSIAKLTLLLGGILALGEAVLLIVQDADQESQVSWVMGASALSVTLISAAIRVVRSAKAISEETERYTSKWILLKILAERFRKETDSTKRLECMIETERVCVEELREFIRTFEKSDYLMW